MKLINYVSVCSLEQWKNLKYFLKFLPKYKTLKQRIVPTDRYKRIKTTLESALTEFSIAFCAFTIQDLEAFVVPFQNNASMIYILHPAMCKTVSHVMSKFIMKKVLSTNYAENLLIGVTKDTNHIFIM